MNEEPKVTKEIYTRGVIFAAERLQNLGISPDAMPTRPMPASVLAELLALAWSIGFTIGKEERDG